MLMQRIFQQYANPYGLSPQGAANFGGFNQGSRPFNPYGGGSPAGGGGGQGTGGGMPSGGMGGSFGGAMPPPSGIGQSIGSGMPSAGSGGSIMALIQALMAARGTAGRQSMGGAMPPAGGGGSIGTALQGSQPPTYQRPGGAAGQSVGYDGYSLGLGNNPIPGEQGYDGRRMGSYAQPQMAQHAPQNVVALMRAMGQMPRPHPMGPPRGRM